MKFILFIVSIIFLETIVCPQTVYAESCGIVNFIIDKEGDCIDLSHIGENQNLEIEVSEISSELFSSEESQTISSEEIRKSTLNSSGRSTNLPRIDIGNPGGTFGGGKR